MIFRRLAEKLEWVGILGLMLMLVFTIIDVLGVKLLKVPLPGSTELVGFAQIIAISSTIAIGLFTGRHITIDFFVWSMPDTVKIVIHKVISVIGFVFFAILSWNSITFGISLQKSGEVSSTAHLPLYPFAFFIAFTTAIASLYFIGELLPSREGSVRDESS